MAGTGDVIVTSDTGATSTDAGGWTYLVAGVITDVTPLVGQEGTRVVLAGTHLHGGGTRTAHVVVAGIPVAAIVRDHDTLVVVELAYGFNVSGLVVLTSDTGAVTTSSVNFSYIVPGEVTSVLPANGREGTRVVIQGTALLGGGEFIASVTLAGFPIVLGQNVSNTRIEGSVSAGGFPALPLRGNVVITANTGARILQRDGFLYEPAGEISTVFPEFGQLGTVVTLTGAFFRGGGNYIADVHFAGVPVSRILNESDTSVTVVAGAATTSGVSEIVIFADTGALLRLEAGWRYLNQSSIASVFPQSGQRGTCNLTPGCLVIWPPGVL